MEKNKDALTGAQSVPPVENGEQQEQPNEQPNEQQQQQQQQQQQEQPLSKLLVKLKSDHDKEIEELNAKHAAEIKEYADTIEALMAGRDIDGNAARDEDEPDEVDTILLNLYGKYEKF